MSSVNIGVPNSLATPGDYLQINFGVGPGGADPGVYGILIVGNRSTAGSGTLDTAVYGPTTTPQLQNETDVITLAGTGSEAHRMWLRVRKVLDLAATIGVVAPPVFMIFPTESVGNQATLDFVIATAATAAGTNRFYCGDEFVDTSITSGMAVDTFGAALAVSINNQTRWPITVAYNSGTDTLTATSKNRGTRANEIRVWSRMLQSVGMTITNNVSTPLAGGTTEDSWTTALATILPTRYYHIISPSTNTAGTNYDDLVTQVLAQSQPLVGIRQHVVAGYVGTQANGSTVAANASINTIRAEIEWLQTAELTAAELASTVGAVMAVYEAHDWSFNFRDFGSGMIRDLPTNKFWKVPAPQTQANWPTTTSIETALNNGLSPIRVNADGTTQMVWSISTQHKNGSNFDYRARSTHLRSVIDRWSDELLGEYRTRFGASKIIDDIAEGEPTPGVGVVQPKQIKALIFEKIDKYANKQLKNAANIKAAVYVARDPDNNVRVGARIPLRVIDLFLQNVIEVDDVSTATV
jgi:phage tail sheath gpL-like